MKQSVFVIEDDSALQDLYSYMLESEFNCRCFCDGDLFFESLCDALPDIILLDIMLPGDDGFAILSRLKSGAATAAIPVIMISAKGEEVTKVKGLNMGADDYITKPFGVLELIARIKAHLRKCAKTKPESICYKDIVIDLSKHQVIANGFQVQTTLKEYNLLRLLCENAEKLQERETIFREVWDDDFVGETRTLDIHIKELRKKLSASGSIAVIQTIRGVGYMLT